MYGDTIGVLHDQNADTPADSRCYLPNAAIGWKQPNAFYYPPAFHSKGLFFNNVNIRHFVVEPLFKNNTYDQYLDNYKDRYCVTTAEMSRASPISTARRN